MPKTLKDANRTVRELNTRANAAFDKGNTDYGVDLFLQILELEPELDEVRMRLRDIQVEAAIDKKVNHSMASLKGLGKTMGVRGAIKKDPVKALHLAEELLKLDILNPAFLELYCDAAVAADRPKAATITLKAVTNHETKNDDLLERLGNLYVSIGDSHQAVETYQRLGELRPGDQTIIKMIKDASAMDTMKKGNWEQEGDFRAKLKDEKASAGLEQESRAHHAQDDMADLVRTQRLRVEREPDNLNLYRPLADNLVKMGELDEALDVLEIAKEKTAGSDPMVLNAISNVTRTIYEHNIKTLKEAGQTDDAAAQEKELREFLMNDAEDKVKRYPNDLGYKYEYGKLLLDRGDVDAAIGQFQQSQRNPQRRINSLFYLGAAFKSKGLYDLAATQLQLALEELPTMDELKKSVVYELGTVLELQGNPAEALKYFKQIFSIDIGYRDVAERVERGYKKPEQAG